MRVRNFGNNVVFSPKRICRPGSEDELLELVSNSGTERVRARGSLHSWSQAPATDGVLIQMEQFDRVELCGELHRPAVRVGAGCRLETLVDELGKHQLALPSNGAVLEQTISGAISTGTHGSGNQSLSSFVRRVRLVGHTPAGNATIHDIRNGSDLLAARCSLGALGVMTEVELDVSHTWCLEERFEKAGSLEEILAGEPEWPLQQFVLLPYAWSWYVFRRRRSDPPASRMRARLYKAYSVVATDLVAHLLFKGVVGLQRLGSAGSVIGFFRHVLPAVLTTGIGATGEATQMTTLNHHWFRHVEMELFVPADALSRALRIVREIVSFHAGEQDSISDQVMEDVHRAGLKDVLLTRHGSYAHHYPIFMRRILHDDTLISMSSRRSTEIWWYSISLFCYLSDRARFREMADLVLEVLRVAVGARPHWGKDHRLDLDQIQPLYPRLAEFREICRRYDPEGTFTNDYTERTLGLGRRER